MNGAESTEKGVRGNTTHGLAAMKRAVKTLDGRVIERVSARRSISGVLICSGTWEEQKM